MGPSDWDVVLKQGSQIALFIIFITGLTRQWWVMGSEIRRADRRISMQDREIQELRQVAYRSNLTAGEARSLARRLVDNLADEISEEA